MKHKLLLALFLSLPLAAQVAISQLPLAQCSLENPPAGLPVIFAWTALSAGGTQLLCYVLTGAVIVPATATTSASIAIPVPTQITLPIFVDGEIPGGAINGINPTFALANTPTAGSLNLFKNGTLQMVNVDYVVLGSSVIFTAAAIPQVNDTLQANYRH